jgi:hypothetical protein
MSALNGLSEHEARQRLANELGKIADKRLPRTFLDPVADGAKFPITAEVVRILASEEWAENPTAALRLVMQRAIAKLPAGTPKNATISWRRAADILLGFEATPPGEGRQQPSYKLDYVPRLERDSGYIGATFKRHVTRSVREELAKALLILGSQQSPKYASPSTERNTRQERASSSEPTLIYRNEYVEKISPLISDTQRVVSIWGEAGTGKSYLAAQTAEVLARGGQVIRLRAANEKRLRDDIIRALITEGFDPGSWDESYCRAILQNTLSGSPHAAVVIVEDVSAEDELWDLISPNPKVPVLVTTRVKLRAPQINAIELHEFTPSQARRFVEANLGPCDEVELESIVQLLGCRPLALAHAVLYIRETEDVTLRDLIEALGESITDGLSLVTLPNDEAGNLVKLYRKVISTLVPNEAARGVMDSFLAVVGRTGTNVQGLVWELLRGEFAYSRVRFESGLRTLAEYGLVRKEAGADSLRTWLSMHPLTCEILRELRADAPREIESVYLHFLEEYKHVDQSGNHDSAWVWTISEEFRACVNLQIGWKNIRCIDRWTWVAIRETNDMGGEYIKRYDIYPHALYGIDYRTGVRERLSAPEARELLELAYLSNVTIDRHWRILSLPTVAPSAYVPVETYKAEQTPKGGLALGLDEAKLNHGSP